jgi:hypothetical protein
MTHQRTIELYYQTIPRLYRNSSSAYLTLSKQLNGQPLRPDVWIIAHRDGKTAELILECKYSSDPSYIATGISQIFSYGVEFPTPPNATRNYMVIGPDEQVPLFAAASNYMVGNVQHLIDVSTSMFGASPGVAAKSEDGSEFSDGDTALKPA